MYILNNKYSLISFGTPVFKYIISHSVFALQASRLTYNDGITAVP